MTEPDDRIVDILTPAELHQLRKSSKAVLERYKQLSKIIREAKINEEYEFPNGERRRVRAEDFINAGSEQMRLLQVHTSPFFISNQYACVFCVCSMMACY